MLHPKNPSGDPLLFAHLISDLRRAFTMMDLFYSFLLRLSPYFIFSTTNIY